MTLTVSESDTNAVKTMEANCAETLPTSELDLLAKLEAANKLIESDAKSLNSLQSTHSRKNSDTSQISINSGKYFECFLSGGNVNTCPCSCYLFITFR